MVLFVVFAVGMAFGSSLDGDAITENEKLNAQINQMREELEEMTSSRDSLKDRLDPIIRAEEASATKAAKKAAAIAKAKAEAEAEAAASKEKAEAEATEAALKKKADAEAAAERAAAEEAANTFTSGVYLVGTDIPPGTYRGTVTGGTGYWARLRDTSGGMNSIIANGLPSGPFVLTIQSGDNAVELRDLKLVKM